MPSKLLQQFVSRKGNFSLAKQKGRLLAARCFGWAEARVEKISGIILRFADLAATYSPVT